MNDTAALFAWAAFKRFQKYHQEFHTKKKLIKNNCDKHGNCYQGTRLTSGEHNQFLYLTIKNTTMETFKWKWWFEAWIY